MIIINYLKIGNIPIGLPITLEPMVIKVFKTLINFKYKILLISSFYIPSNSEFDFRS